MRNVLPLTLVCALAAGLATGATAQVAPPPRGPAPAAPAPLVDRDVVVDMAALEAGANSFTEGQARSRMEEAGFNAVSDLVIDSHGFWRGRALLGGRPVDVAMDYRGRIATTGAPPPPVRSR